MVHSSKTLINPERIQRTSLVFASIISLALIMNSSSFNTLAKSVFSRNTLHKIEAKTQNILDLGLSEDVDKSDKDLDNSFAD